MSLTPVLLIGGAGPPANVDFSPLVDELGGERPLLPITPVAFQGRGVQQGHTLAVEVAAVAQEMDRAGHSAGHIVAYSGGVAVALAFADARPERVASLMLEEPAWVGNDGVPEAERVEAERLAAALKNPPFEAVSEFRELMVKPDVLAELRPLPPDATWLPSVVQGVLAFIGAFRAQDLDWEKLRESGIPFRFAVGSRSNPLFEARARRAAAHIPGSQVDVYAGLHHLNPPHRGAAHRFADSLRELWREAEPS